MQTVSAKATLLIVDDEVDVREVLEEYFTSHGYTTIGAENAAVAKALAAKHPIDLALVDINMPGEDGLSLARHLRERYAKIAIVMLTSAGTVVDRIVGLEMGADDYVPKPFDPRELLARIRAVLRRNGAAEPKRATTKQIYHFAGWTMDCSRRRLMAPGDVRVELTMAEFNLLQTFVKSAQRVLTRDQLIELSGGDSDYSFDRSIDILVSRLRRKMEDDPKTPKLILTVRSGGYQFLPETTSE